MLWGRWYRQCERGVFSVIVFFWSLGADFSRYYLLLTNFYVDFFGSILWNEGRENGVFWRLIFFSRLFYFLERRGEERSEDHLMMTICMLTPVLF